MAAVSVSCSCFLPPAPDHMSPNAFAANPSGRLVSLDVFRGLTIAGMVLVNNPGTWSSIYWPLLHAEWHGWTPTDLVFPFFLFIVGVSITLAFGRRVEEGTVKRDLYLKVHQAHRDHLWSRSVSQRLSSFPTFDGTNPRRATADRDLLFDRFTNFPDDKSKDSTPDCARAARRLLAVDD